jgi:vacuolar-type H+-ATPase subunit F/Vma7
MGELIVITTPELEAGYRLAGVATRTAGSVADATEALQELLLQPGDGDVVAVHEPFFNQLDASLQRRIDSLVSPLVIALPGGEGADAEAERRARHLRILWEAVGYQITFEPGDGST